MKYVEHINAALIHILMFYFCLAEQQSIELEFLW